MRIVWVAVLALSACERSTPAQLATPPGSKIVAEQIEAVFARTCGVTSPNPDKVDAAIRSAGIEYVRTEEAYGLSMYQMREFVRGVRTSVRLEKDAQSFTCSVSSSNAANPSDVVSLIASNIERAGGHSVVPAAQPGYSDCQAFQLGGVVRSTCVYDFTPHGMSAELMMTVPVEPALAS